MASASSSSSASTGINTTGGNATINKPNIAPWIVAGLGLLLAALVFLKLKHKK